MVVVLVGPIKRRFEVHKGLVCSRSDFFKAAFMGTFQEADGTITLPEQEPATFEYFVYWLYTDSLKGHHSNSINPTLKDLTDNVRSEVKTCELLHAEDLPPSNPHRKLWEHANYHDRPFASLIDLYILADALQVPRLKDAAITALIEVYGFISAYKMNYKMYWAANRPIGMAGPRDGLNMAWGTLPEESKLCQALLRLFCDNTAGINDGETYFHPRFVVAMGNLFCGTMAA